MVSVEPTSRDFPVALKLMKLPGEVGVDLVQRPGDTVKA